MPTATPQPTATATKPPSATPEPSRTPTATPTPSPLPSPSPSPTPSITPLPTLPPLQEPGDGRPLALSLAWQYGADGHLTDGAVLTQPGGETFLAASLGRSLYAFDGQGAVVWRARARGPLYALALLAEGRIASGDDAGWVTVHDKDGRQIWAYDTGNRVIALESWQGGLLAGGWDERLTLLDADGQPRWQAGLHGPLSAIVAGPHLALAATLEGDIEAFDPQGECLWRYQAGAAVTALAWLDIGATEARLLASLQDGRLLALDRGGQLVWQQRLDPAGGSPVLLVARPPAGAGPHVLLGSGGDSPRLALLSAQGEVLWQVSLPAPVGATAAADLDGDGQPEILVGLGSGEIRAYDWQGRLRGAVQAGLAVWGLDVGASGVGGETVLVRADVVAWQLVAQAGAGGAAWLPPPPMLPPGSEPAAAQPAEGEAVLVFLGDVALGRSVEAQLARYGPAYPWTGLEPLLRPADLAAANLEGVLTTQGRPLDKRYLIRAHPTWGQTLVESGLDLLTLANNHALDYGPAGLDETLDTLEASGLGVVGVGREGEDARRPALYTLRGVRVAVLGYAAARWDGSVDVPATERIAWARPAAVQSDVRAAREQADVVIVLLHAGTEYARQPSTDQVAVARAAVEAGADLVVGHHPHVTQTVERSGSALIVYSLGDALFDIPRPGAMQGHLLRVLVSRAGLRRAELWPFWIADAIQPRLLVDGEGQPPVRVIYP